jgi:hypothetical protein
VEARGFLLWKCGIWRAFGSEQLAHFQERHAGGGWVRLFPLACPRHSGAVTTDIPLAKTFCDNTSFGISCSITIAKTKKYYVAEKLKLKTILIYTSL